jgi:hypothetical protein
MKSIYSIILFLSMPVINSCVTQFIPEVEEQKESLVVEGLITDQPGTDTVKIYKSMPLGENKKPDPFRGCTVIINDDLGNSYDLTEITSGVYITDSSKFRGNVGRKYTLVIHTNSVSAKNYSYESSPMEMIPVPPVGSLYYEKTIIAEEDMYHKQKDGCQIYLDTYDPDNKCKFYRWNYIETWEIHIPYRVENNICWVSNNSDIIMIKNTSVLNESIISGLPLLFISDQTDRLMEKYSIIVNQYSLNYDEYLYWEKLQRVTQDVGGLYDIVPSSISGNIHCIEDPNEKVLGFFSVSAKTSKRIFIEEYFSGIVFPYLDCESVKKYGSGDPAMLIPGLGTVLWIIIDATNTRPPYWILTDNKACADCTVRGTKVKPGFWDNPR